MRRLFKGDSFIAVDRDVYGALETGKITFHQWAVYSLMLEQVAFETGIWRGDAARIEHACNYQLSKKVIQNTIKELCEKGWLNSFHVPGSKKPYPVAIHGYKVRFGKLKGHVLNAVETVDPSNPVYIKEAEIQESGQESGQALGSPGAADANGHRTVTESSPNGQRIISESSPNGQGLPERRNDPDVLDNLEGIDAPDQPTIHKVDGWLALLPKIMQLTGRSYTMSKAEAGQLRQSGSTHGPIPVIAAFNQFVRRPEGFDYLRRPFSLFIDQIGHWIDRAHKKTKEDYVNPAHEHQFLAELGDVKLGEDVQSLLFYLWVDLRLEDENLLNRDTLALLISEQVSREPAVVSTPKVIATSSAAF